MSVGIVSLALALLLPRAELAWSGWIYLSMAILVPVYSGVSQRVDGKSVKGKVMNVRQTKMLAESKSLRSQQGSCRPASPVYGPVAPPVRTGCV